MSSILLMAAVFASLAFGVLMAYGVCLGLFTMLQVNMVARRPVVRGAVAEG